jgi:hypothetical protein
MKILTQEILNAFKKQGHTGNKSAKDIKIVLKIFNPYGGQTWYIYEMDDDDIYWAFVNLGDREMSECGTVSMSELLSLRVPPFNMPLERDKFFKPLSMSLEEVMNKVKSGQHV